MPVDWATTQVNLGDALVTLGERKHDPKHLNEALICFEQARPVFQAAGMAQAETIGGMIDRLKNELAKSTGAPDKPADPGG